MLIVSLGIPYTPSISAVAVMYAYVTMIILAGPSIFKKNYKANNFSNYFLITFSTDVMPHWWFMEVYLSIRNSTLGFTIEWVLVTQIPQEAHNILILTLSFFHMIHSALINYINGFWMMQY